MTPAAIVWTPELVLFGFGCFAAGIACAFVLDAIADYFAGRRFE